ncbi:hypothetical protein PTKIN_Ptkin10aG0019300 [Pterospermum kingtungense]
MSQEPFIYSFVARGTMILAEYTEFTGNFPAIAAQCLQKLPSSNNKFTYNCDHHTFNFLVEDGYAYCVVAKDTVGKQISIAFLERMKADFKKRYGGGKADTAIAKSLNKEFGPIMKEHMKYIIEHAEEIEKLLKVKAQAYRKQGTQIRRKMWYQNMKIKLVVLGILLLLILIIWLSVCHGFKCTN